MSIVPAKSALLERLMADVDLHGGSPRIPPEKLAAWLDELDGRRTPIGPEVPTHLVALALTLQDKWPGQCDVLLDQLMLLALAVLCDEAAVKEHFAAAGVDVERTHAAVTGSSDTKIPVGARGGTGRSTIDVMLEHRRQKRGPGQD